MTVYVDSSAFAKRYVAKADSDESEALLLSDVDWLTRNLPRPSERAGALSRSSRSTSGWPRRRAPSA